MEGGININWSFSALEMLAEIHEYISEKSQMAADKYVDGIYDSVKNWKSIPSLVARVKQKSSGKEAIDVANIKATSLYTGLKIMQ